MALSNFNLRPALFLAGAALSVVVATGCDRPAASQNNNRGRGGGPSVSVRTTTVQRMTVQRQVDLAGTLLSPDQARVSAEAAGIIRAVLIDIGREVRAGDPLVMLAAAAIVTLATLLACAAPARRAVVNGATAGMLR